MDHLTDPNQTTPIARPTPDMNTFQWLLILGFPPATAAAAVRPDIFRSNAEVPATTDPRAVIYAWVDTTHGQESAPFAA